MFFPTITLLFGLFAFLEVILSRFPTIEVESDLSLSLAFSQHSNICTTTTPATNSSRKKIHYAGVTPPANTKKDKKGPKISKIARIPSTHPTMDTTATIEGAVGKL